MSNHVLPWWAGGWWHTLSDIIWPASQVRALSAPRRDVNPHHYLSASNGINVTIIGLHRYHQTYYYYIISWLIALLSWNKMWSSDRFHTSNTSYSIVIVVVYYVMCVFDPPDIWYYQSDGRILETSAEMWSTVSEEFEYFHLSITTLTNIDSKERNSPAIGLCPDNVKNIDGAASLPCSAEDQGYNWSETKWKYRIHCFRW